MAYRFKISTLLIVVVVLALDFAWLHALNPNARTSSVLGFELPGFDIGVLPMANLLAIGAAFLLRWPHDLDPFFWGFEAFGAAALFLFMILCWAFPNLAILLIVPLFLLASLWTRIDPSGPSILIVGAISFTAPQLLIATLGGFLTRFLVHRQTSVPHNPV